MLRALPFQRPASPEMKLSPRETMAGGATPDEDAQQRWERSWGRHSGVGDDVHADGRDAGLDLVAVIEHGDREQQRVA